MAQEHLSLAASSVEEPATPPPPGAQAALRSSAASRYALGTGTALLLALAAVGAYWKAFDCGFVNYDDDQYVYDNPNVVQGLCDNKNIKNGLNRDRIQWAFTNKETVNWYPLTWLSLQLDASLWGVERPFGFHLTNVILHVVNALLLLWILMRMTGRLGRSAFVAGLFALHPLHVESVAWVTERKDVLSALFWMLALAAYVWYARRPRWWRYLLVVLALALGLMAKSMLVTLPCVLFLLDYWPLRRYPKMASRDGEAAPGFRTAPASWLRLILEKIPLFLLAAASTGMTMYAQQQGGEANPLSEMPGRIENALISYVSYIGKTIWPAGLVCYYPFPKEIRGQHLSLFEAVMAGLLLLAITIVAAAAARRKPYLIVGWLWFLGTLAPVIGLIQVLGDYSMADRFTYIPLIGLFIAGTWAAADWLPRAGVRPWLSAAAAVVVLAACAVGTWQQVGYWHDSLALWQHALDVNANNYLAYNNIGCVRIAEGNAIWNRLSENNRKGVPITDDDYRAVNAKYMEGERCFRKAVQCDPSYGLAHYDLAETLDKECWFNTPENVSWPKQPGNQRRWRWARAEYLAAAIWWPNNAGYQCKAGFELASQNQYKEAIPFYEDALRLYPDYAYAHLYLGWALYSTGDLDEAAAHYQAFFKADLKLVSSGDLALGHNNMARVLFARGDMEGAVAECRAALAILPDYADAHDWLGAALMQQGKALEGAEERAEALRLRRSSGQ
ncbi:MAG TPA: tetratricopeptide repeat protein [Gemmataceae bacterium]|nr:tetratricopeptide repeat protein [Gemmataceae bacterium]